MRRPTARAWLVEGLTISRLLAALVFACIAFQTIPAGLKASLYGLAMLSDLIDGFLARRMKLRTHLGQVLDLISDKSLTIVSLLYAAALGVSIAPLALIGAREILMIGARLVVVNGEQLLPTNRAFGGTMAAALWLTTLALILAHDIEAVRNRVVVSYWAVAAVFLVNAVLRISSSARRIIACLERDRL